MKIKIIPRTLLISSVPMAQAIEAVKAAYIALADGEAVMPQRIQITVPAEEGISLFMPAYISGKGSPGVKVVSVFPHNPERNLPTISALVISLDSETGRPVAVMDGTSLTALRTGAASGVATDLLSRKESNTAAIFGAGVQGRTQLEAVCTVRDLQRVYVYDPHLEAAFSFAEDFRKQRITPELIVADSAAEAARNADIICTATTSAKPVFSDTDLKTGVHINAVGSFTPEMQEVPVQTVVRAKVVVDQLEACLEEAGDLIIPLSRGAISSDHIHSEIGEIAAGYRPGRKNDDEITLFKSVGLAVQDVAVADLVLRNLKDSKLAVEVEI